LLWLQKKEDLAVDSMICAGACMAGLLQLLLWVQQRIFLVIAPWGQAAGGQQAPATGLEGLPTGVLVQDSRDAHWPSDSTESCCAVQHMCSWLVVLSRAPELSLAAESSLLLLLRLWNLLKLRTCFSAGTIGLAVEVQSTLSQLLLIMSACSVEPAVASKLR
jgi:hypothetical protein